MGWMLSVAGFGGALSAICWYPVSQFVTSTAGQSDLIAINSVNAAGSVGMGLITGPVVFSTSTSEPMHGFSLVGFFRRNDNLFQLCP